MNLRDYPAAMALQLMLEGKPDQAEQWLKVIPRIQRGPLNIALEDLSIKLSRLGNQ